MTGLSGGAEWGEEVKTTVSLCPLLLSCMAASEVLGTRSFSSESSLSWVCLFLWTVV